MKVIWTSRHPMTDSQLGDLKNVLRTDSIDVEHFNVTWDASADEASDILENSRIWATLAARAFGGNGKRPVIAGVFPSVAFEALGEADFSESMAPLVLTPVSRRAPELRTAPDAPIPFVHARWAVLAGGER